MFSRFATVVLLATILPVVSQGQEDNGVILGSNIGGFGLMACGVQGQTYFSHPVPGPSGGGNLFSVFEVSRDGAIVTLPLPKMVIPAVAAFGSTGLSVLAAYYHHGHEDYRYELYQFDNQAKVTDHHPVTTDFIPMQMAVLPSGKTIVAGHLGDMSRSHRDEWTYVGAVLDADGGVITRFDFPSPPDDGKWTFAPRQKMIAGDGVAYIVLQTDSESATAIAKISGTGRVDIKLLPDPPDDDQRHHHIWLLGPGVAVEEYSHPAEKPRIRMHYDEYDLNSGEKIATKVSPGGSAQCYFGAEVSWTTANANDFPSHRLPPGALGLLFSRLENQAAGPPPARP